MAFPAVKGSHARSKGESCGGGRAWPSLDCKVQMKGRMESHSAAFHVAQGSDGEIYEVSHAGTQVWPSLPPEDHMKGQMDNHMQGHVDNHMKAITPYQHCECCPPRPAQGSHEGSNGQSLEGHHALPTLRMLPSTARTTMLDRTSARNASYHSLRITWRHMDS